MLIRGRVEIENSNFLIVRFGGELGIKKKWTRNFYEKQLSKNIKKVLKHYSLPFEKIVRFPGRLFIETNSPEITSKLTNVFGVSSVSPAIKASSELEDIIKTTINVFSNCLKKQRSFAVRCHRVGKHPYTSLDVCKKIGSEILNKNKNLKVDLTNPQITITIEVRNTDSYIFTKTLSGPDGFPVGTQLKLICLLSGGMDSAVACWLAMKRGCPVIPVFFDNSPLSDETVTNKAIDNAKVLFNWSIGFSRKIYVVPNGHNLQTFMLKAPRKLTCILCKRMMYRITEKIAEKEKTGGIITGESIGEQASQTVTNLFVLNQASKIYPIHRPLLGFNKIETELVAKKIGVYEISTRRASPCMAVPTQPSTKAKLEKVERAEKKLDINEMIDKSLESIKTLIL